MCRRVCACMRTGEPLSALCANKTAALWDTGHPGSNSITLLKYYTSPSQGSAPSWCVCMSKVCVSAYINVCECASSYDHVGVWWCTLAAVNSPMCVYPPCCQWLDSPFTIHCLCLLSKCWRSHRSPSCRDDIGISEGLMSLCHSATEHTKTLLNENVHLLSR